MSAPVMHAQAERLDFFHVGQVWESPRGSKWEVVDVVRGQKATLKPGSGGAGRQSTRQWDAVIGWVLLYDPEDKA